MRHKHKKAEPIERIAPAVIEKIRSLMDELTRSQRMLAEYIIQRPEKVGFLPINELAQAAGISVATVIRFCNTLGYSGYVELGREIQISIQNELSLLGRFNLAQGAAGSKTDRVESAFERILSLEIESLSQLTKSINKADFFNCLDWMSQADHVVIIGTMASVSLTEYFGYAASKVLPSVRTVVSIGGQNADFLKGLGPDSLVFLIAFPRYPKTTVALGELARRQGCRIVALTDSNQSPIIQIAQIAFLITISATSFVDAYAAPVAFINGLIAEYAARYPGQTKKNLAYFEKFADGLNIWHQTKLNIVRK